MTTRMPTWHEFYTDWDAPAFVPQGVQAMRVIETRVRPDDPTILMHLVVKEN
jgi:hypothetical protein